MLLRASIGGQDYAWDTAEPIELSTSQAFHQAEDVPSLSLFGGGVPRAEPYRVGEFVGDTRQGGSVNVEVITVAPHLHGTHTESIGHVTDERVFVSYVLREAFVPATVISVTPVRAGDTDETSTPTPQPGDTLITARALAEAYSRAGAREGFAEGLIIRTLPNEPSKRTADYDQLHPAYFTAEAMALVVAWGVQHLVVDMPSLDRLDDGGALTAHRIYWGLPPGSKSLREARRPLATVSELAFVPDALHDGPVILHLQVPPWLSDAAPSRIMAYVCTPE